jgi:3',5'-cyclic AMP phosphodiesterase CpdA
MSDITLLHLSDLHFKRREKDRETFLKDVKRKMMAAIKTHLAKNQNVIDFVVVTGDIAFSGKEYDKARDFFNDLKLILPADIPFLVVPGNHDVDRGEISEYFSLHSIVQAKKTDGFLENEKERNKNVYPKFNAFRAFVHELNPHLYLSEGDYFWVKDFEDKHVSFLGLNTCWASENDNDRNHITLGYPQVMTALERSTISNRILLMHHPFNWLNEEDFNHYCSEIFNACGLVLHGHTHSDKALVLRSPSDSCICLGANASYTGDKEGFIGFQFIHVSFRPEGVAVTVWPYRLDERNWKRFVPDTHRYKGQEGPFFKLESFEHSKIDETKPLPPLEIPEAYKEWVRHFHSTMDIELLAKKGEVIRVNLPEVYIPIETRNPFYKEKIEKNGMSGF